MATDIEIRKVSQQLGELNKTMNRQNAILEKILRMMVLDYKEGKAADGSGEEGGDAGPGKYTWAESVGGGQGEASVRQGAPSPRELAEAIKEGKVKYTNG